jgi:hypothetical protein
MSAKRQGGGGLRALGAALPRIAAPILGKRGLAAGRLVADWPAIVGAELADVAVPDRLSFPHGERSGGTLRLKVAPSAALEIQHRAPLLIERINVALGYPAVARLSLVQAPPPARRRPAPPPRRELGEAERRAIGRQVEKVVDPDLREALGRLGEAVAAAKPPRR